MCSPSWTPLPSPSPSHPSGSSQCTSHEHPVSCIEPGLAIYFTYDNTHDSMLFSQIIPLLPSPTESKVCSFSLRLFSCLIYRVIVTIFLNSIYMRMAPYSSTLAWKIPWMEDPGRLQSMGSIRVGHDWATELNWTENQFIQSQVSQKEKHQYSILTHIYGI